MDTLYVVTLVIAVIVAVAFSALIFITGKGDAMSGGGQVRTTFKGRATFDDQISKVTLIMGIGFMALMLILDVMAQYTTSGRR